jgi:tetratricopeptide (TPR) repeat protein
MVERVSRKTIRQRETANIPAFIKNLSYIMPIERSAVQILKRVKLDPAKIKDIKAEGLISGMVQICGLPEHIASQLAVRPFVASAYESIQQKINILTTRDLEISGNLGVRLLYWGSIFSSAEAVKMAMDTVSVNKGIKVPDPNPNIPTKLDIQILISDHKFIDAIDRLNERLKADQNDAWAWMEKGDILRILGKYQKAVSCYHVARVLDKRNIAAIDGLMRTNSDRKKHEDIG